MSEPTQQTAEENNAELGTLRRVNAELLAKRAKDKAKISELESTVTGLQGQIVERDDRIRHITIDGPLKSMAESISTVPDLFIEQFSKHFKLELIDGVLTVLSDGKAITDAEGKSIAFERDALARYLIYGDDARAKTFQAFVISSRACGAGNPPMQRHSSPAAPKPSQFGLR